MDIVSSTLSHLFHIHRSQSYILHISQKSVRQFETGNHRGKWDLIQTEWNTNESVATFWSGLPNFRTIWHMLLVWQRYIVDRFVGQIRRSYVIGITPDRLGNIPIYIQTIKIDEINK